MAEQEGKGDEPTVELSEELIEQMESGSITDPRKIEEMLGVASEHVDRSRIDDGTNTQGNTGVDAPGATAGEGAAAAAEGDKDKGKDGEGAASAAGDGGAKPGDDAGAAAAAEPAGDGEDDGEGAAVRARDGKGFIPYAVLRDTRRRAAAAEARAEELEKELRKGDGAGGDAAEAVERAVGSGEDGVLTDDDIKELKAEFPDKLVDKLLKLNTALVASNQARKTLSEEEEAVEQQRVAEEAQAAIDTIPELAALQAAGGEKWQEAIEVDRALRALPRWKGKPVADRFRAVAEELELVKKPSAAAPAEQQPKTPTRKELQDAAAAKVAAAAPAKPNTISDLQAGDPPDQSIQQKATRMSPIELESHMAGMTEQERANFLASLV